ncbi:LA_3696 family protein [Candidatus Magnetominusculus dajiuhuensis]|uniref:LA_3696 family protein n=1 Tax=Candidatus Magnetominusculus dajiuhuensis TaxID=3137712 RepID=UPI003B42C217
MSVIAIPEVLRRRLGDDGVEAFIKVINESEANSRKDLSTKEDISRLEVKIESSKSEIIKWVAAMLVAQASIMAVMFKLLGLIK